MALRVVGSPNPDEVTLAEAAELLGVHPNTVRNRIRSGVYQARKAPSAAGPEIYLIKRAELDLPTPPAPDPWSVKVREAFWSSDLRIRRVQLAVWVVGGLMNLAVFSFGLGRAWELVAHERQEELVKQ